MICTELMTALSKFCKPNQVVILYFDDSLIFKSNNNTGVFESTNGLDDENPDFIEFYDCSFEVSEILSPSSEVDLQIKQGNYFAISEHSEPIRIEAEDKTLIWQK